MSIFVAFSENIDLKKIIIFFQSFKSHWLMDPGSHEFSLQQIQTWFCNTSIFYLPFWRKEFVEGPGLQRTKNFWGPSLNHLQTFVDMDATFFVIIYTNSLDSFYPNFTNMTFQKVPIPHLTHTVFPHIVSVETIFFCVWNL